MSVSKLAGQLSDAGWTIDYFVQDDSREPWERSNWERYELIATFYNQKHEYVTLARFAGDDESKQAARLRILERAAAKLLKKGTRNRA